MASTTGTPCFSDLLLTLLSALPGAATSTEPPAAILPLLSPILRQRVQLLSSASTNDPWIRLLTYDVSKVSKLTEAALNGTLEPHPVSGKVEIDWECDAHIQYRRLDAETLQCLVVLHEFGLFVRLVHCGGEKTVGDDGWRVGEVGVGDAAMLESFGGLSSLNEAELAFIESSGGSRTVEMDNSGTKGNARAPGASRNNADDEDDDYWGQYDTMGTQTPATKQSPAPASMLQSNGASGTRPSNETFYSRYDSVQPAMDNHDPDEEVDMKLSGLLAPPLGLATVNRETGAWTPRSNQSARSAEEEVRTASLVHPRPESSASSNGSKTVARLEETAEWQDQSQYGVKQHVSRSIRNLFLLSRASGIDREDFELLVKRELDMLGMVEDEI